MKRPLAYITAAWCGDPDADMELAARYCRMAYEAGFSPICPILYLPLFINDAIPEEHKNGIDMRRDMGNCGIQAIPAIFAACRPQEAEEIQRQMDTGKQNPYPAQHSQQA